MDDAAVVRPPHFDDGEGESDLVMTMDVVTPMTNDPEAFGAIAATNALSDVYAMGGTPQTALSFVGFPTDVLPLSVLREILLGVADACQKAGCGIVGGHSIIDPEPKVGLSVTGSVPRGAAWTHGNARVGQVLVLTKPIGTGVIVQATKKGEASEAHAAFAVSEMRRLNRVACSLGRMHGVTAATDVTGFGLLGHLKHLAEASRLAAVVHAENVPLFDGVREYVGRGLVPGGTKKNLAYVTSEVAFGDAVDETTRLLLCDAQTSGGLLMTTDEESARALVARLVDVGHRAAIVGELVPLVADGKHLRVV